jgi:hypothetical protein
MLNMEMAAVMAKKPVAILFSALVRILPHPEHSVSYDIRLILYRETSELQPKNSLSPSIVAIVYGGNCYRHVYREPIAKENKL